MTLATRCSACGTSFRVVQDQLKVSGGWVRCGRCNEVFNALEALYEIDTQPGSLAVETARQAVHAAQLAQQSSSGAAPPARSAAAPRAPQAPPPPPPWPAPAPAAQARVSGGWPAPAAAIPPASPPAVPVSPAPAASAPLPPARSVPVPDTPPWSSPATSPPVSAAEVPDAPQALLAGDLGEPAAASTGGGAAPTEAAPLSPSPPLPPSEPAAFDDRPVRGFDDVETRLEPRSGEAMGDAPSFMRPPWQDTRSARPGASRTARRLALALAVLLALQLTLAWRDQVAARVPAVAGLLRALCVPLGCQVLAPRQLSALTVEGSQLRQRPGTANGYDLTVALRNRASTVTLLPAVELTLTDSQGQALIRRVLLAQDWRNGAAQLPANADITLQTVLVVADSRVAGYTVEIFYP